MLNRKWNDEEIEFLKENYNKLSYSDIGKILNRTYKSVARKIENLGLKKRNVKIWSENEVDYLIKNYGKIPAIIICKNLNRSFSAVTLKAMYLGLKTTLGNRWKATYNERFFDEWSDELAWLVGVALSDGHVSNLKYGKYIWVRMCDKDVLEKVKLITGYKGNITPLKREKPHYKKPYIITIGGEKIWQFFTDLGMDNHKSYTAKWPIGLSNEYTNHFVRGVFDGDGSISFNKNGYPFARICGTESLVDSISKCISLHFTKHHNTKNNYTIQYTGERAKNFLEFIYKDSKQNIRMDRKYNKVLGHLNGTVFN